MEDFDCQVVMATVRGITREAAEEVGTRAVETTGVATRVADMEVSGSHLTRPRHGTMEELSAPKTPLIHPLSITSKYFLSIWV